MKSIFSPCSHQSKTKNISYFLPVHFDLELTSFFEICFCKKLWYSVLNNMHDTKYMFWHESLRRAPRPGGGGYSSMICVGTYCWDLESTPIFIPNFAEKWDHFYTRAANFKQFTKNFTLFSKIVKISSKFCCILWSSKRKDATNGKTRDMLLQPCLWIFNVQIYTQEHALK